MKKKFICTVCGYVYEGEHAPEKCPMCGVPGSKFKELVEDEGLSFVAEHSAKASYFRATPCELGQHWQMRRTKHAAAAYYKLPNQDFATPSQ